MNMPLSSAARLAHEERGTGVPVVFIHGLTFSRRTWEPLLDRLSGRLRCVAVDLPGHGGSPGLPGSLEDVSRQLHALLTDQGIARPVVVGHSIGAAIATIYAAAFPVAGAVNVDQALDMRPLLGLIHQIAPALRGPGFTAAFEPIRQSIGVELLPEPLRSATLATQTVRQDLVLAYWHDALRRSPEDLQAQAEVAIRRITAPYLAVFGHQLGADERAALQSLIPHLDLEEWPDRGHMVHLMDCDRFAARLASFIDTCGGSV
jgi:pimeloyl-ACP methyl ester carboxylesterase